MHIAARSELSGQPPASDDPGSGQEPSLQPVALEPGRPVVAEEERGPRGNVGCEARGGAHGDAFPPDLGGRTRGRVDQVVAAAPVLTLPRLSS